MKRHTALRKFSSDHHRALVLARRLCSLGEGGVTPVVVQMLLGQWQSEIAPHLTLEEQWLLPLLARFSSPDHPLIQETLRQHLHLRASFDAINECGSGGAMPAVAELHALGDALREHVRFEERELLPAVEATLPNAQLLRLQQQLG